MNVDLERLLDELAAEHLIRPIPVPEPGFVFNHVPVQETAYQSLLLKDRREYHRLIATAFEQEQAQGLTDYSPTLAFHYWHGEDWGNAVKYSRRAGERAMRVYGLREAIGCYVQALQALDRQGKWEKANKAQEERAELLRRVPLSTSTRAGD